MLVKTAVDGKVLCRIPVCAGFSRQWFEAACSIPDGVHALFFTYSGEGSIHFHAFELK